MDEHKITMELVDLMVENNLESAVLVIPQPNNEFAILTGNMEREDILQIAHMLLAHAEDVEPRGALN